MTFFISNPGTAAQICDDAKYEIAESEVRL